MAGQRVGLPLLLLSLAGLAGLHLVLGSTAMDETATMSPSLPTSPTPMETSALLPTTDSTTIATLPPSSSETGASTLEGSSTSPGTISTSPSTVPPPVTPALTDTSAEPLTTLADTTSNTTVSTGVPGSTSAHSQPPGTTPGISTPTVEPTPGTSIVSETTSAVKGTEPSSPATNSVQTPGVTLSTPADLPAMLPICPTTLSNTNDAHLFLSLRLTAPMDLVNATVQELVSQLRGDLQTAFPYARLEVECRRMRSP